MQRASINNRYSYLRALGEGAMGVVMLVRDETQGEEVALKIISAGAKRAEPDAAGASPGPGTLTAAKSTMQFRQEFRLMTQLRHPNCCAVYDYGLSNEGEPYFTMEVVPGQGLDESLPVAVDVFKSQFSQLLLALAYVHRQGFVHLDIKSANVRVRPDGLVKLMDYGLMEHAGQASSGIRGTLPYMSPEMIRRGPLDQRADLYSAGVLAYEMLTGRLPFERPRPLDLIRAHLGEQPVPPSRLATGIPAEIEKTVMRLLAKEPVERFQSADEALEALGYEAPAGIGGSLLTSPMVGREAELTALQTGLAALRAQQAGSHWHLAGTAGIGKSRLLEEFRFIVQLEHLPYACGVATRDQLVPFAPITTLLRSLLPLLRRHLPRALAEAAPVLVRLLPELDVARAPEIESPKHEMLRLHATLTGLLKELAVHQPLVLVLENWQWADVPSLEFVQYFSRNVADAAIMTILASQDLQAQVPAEGPAVTRLEVAALSDAAVQRVVCNMLGSEQVEPAFSGAVGQVSSRSPLYIERLLDHMVKVGALQRRAGRWNTELDVAALQLPGSLNALLAAKLEAVPADALAVARAAAAFDQPASIDFLQIVTGLEDARLFAAVELLQREQLLVPDDDGQFRISQRLYHDALYAALGPEERTALHLTIARWLLAQVAEVPLASVPTEQVMPLAVHTLLGGLVDEAIASNLEAGSRSARLYALADAERYLRAGLALVRDGRDEPVRRTRLAYLRLLGDVMRWAGRGQEALDCLREAVDLATELDDALALGRLLTTTGKAFQMLSQTAEALTFCERSAAVCLASGDLAGAARGLIACGRLHFFQSRLDDAKAAATRALELAGEAADPGILGQAYALAGFLFVASEPEKLAQGVTHLDSAVQLLTDVGDRNALVDACNLLGNAHLMLGNFERARLAFETCATIGREYSLAEELSFALVSLATIALDTGDYAGAMRLAAATEAVARGIEAHLPLGMAIALEGLAAAYLGDFEGAERLTLEAVAKARAIASPYLEAIVLVRRLEALVQMARMNDAQAVCLELERQQAGASNSETEGVMCSWKAIAATQLGQRDVATAAAAKAKALATRTGAKGELVLVGVAEALGKMAQADFSGARAVATETLALAEGIGAEGRATDLRGILGELCLALGDKEAATHFQAMRVLAERAQAPVATALALFGLAAADPYAPAAKGYAVEARARLEGLMAALPPGQLAAFAEVGPVKRVLAGNFVDFGLPRAPRMGAQTGKLGLNWGGL